jgi:drug/metabolite transporter (DMT)-like permease
MALMGYARVDERALTLPFVQFVAMGLAAAPVALLLEDPSYADLEAALPALLYVGVLTSALVFSVLSVALRFSQPAEAVIILGTECVFGAIAGAIVYGDRLSASSWAGAILIVLSALLVQLVPSRRKV